MQRQLPRLRTKTGCSSCRLSKKKCDETTPTCRRCQAGGRACEWPNTADSTDRRRLTRRLPRSVDDGCRMPELTLNDSTLVQVTSARAIETVLSRHFTFGFYELILLPSCSQHFFNGWLTQLCRLAKRCPSLYNSFLACAASHLYMMDGADTMLQLGLTYYSNAIRQLLKSLANDQQLRDNEGLLSAIIFLIIHGCQGVQTFDDIPNHMRAASRMSLEVLQPTAGPRPYLDSVLVESVLFHSFHACTGLWSDTDDGSYYIFDSSLWKKAELYFGDPDESPGLSSAMQGPVLGVPTPLLRLAAQLRQLYRDPLSFSTDEIRTLHAKVLDWETKLFFNVEETPSGSGELPDPPDAARDECCEDITTLYVLAVSLLLSMISDSDTLNQNAIMARPWQLRVAAEILRKHEYDQRWQRSYMGNWPVYTLGSFASHTSARRVMQADLQRRWTLTKMGQSKRFLDDMEMMWRRSDPLPADLSCGYGPPEFLSSGAELHSPGSSEAR